MTAKKIGVITIYLISLVFLVWGWRLFYFLTDDAYIAFRYISNRHLGFGYTWNPPPFLPVEGYTSFLWVVLLDLVWVIFGIQPPRAANLFGLFFACGTLLLSVFFVFSLNLRRDLAERRNLFLALVLLGILTNRTFLAWTSSGLETSMFNFFVILWVFLLFSSKSQTARWQFFLSFSAMLIALTRPDGYLFVMSTAGIISLGVLQHVHEKRFRLRDLSPFLPLLLVLAHVFWRKSFYGAWFPNTYYAKQVESWPAAGSRYALSFVMEYSLVFWIGLVTWVVIRRYPQWSRQLKELSKSAKLRTLSFDEPMFIKIIGYLTIIFHFSYYTFKIGGDYFEYRVYSHLIVLIFVSVLWFLNDLMFSWKKAVVFFSIIIFLSWPIPWTHWLYSQSYTTRDQTINFKLKIAEIFPWGIRHYVEIFDQMQLWLISHGICIRHQEHKVFAKYFRQQMPPRKLGEKEKFEKFSILEISSPGYLGWVFPHLMILDTLGLNDYVVARTPAFDKRFRFMAHERHAPEAYLQCFEPNVSINWPRGEVRLNSREKPLTAEKISQCEKFWREEIIRYGEDMNLVKLDFAIKYLKFNEDSRDKGIIYLNEVLVEKPKNAEAHFYLGIAYEAKGRTKKAVFHYQMAMQINPEWQQPSQALSAILLYQKRYRDALEVAQKGLIHHPRSTLLLNNLGIAYFAQGQIKEALRVFDRCLKEDPEDARAHLNKGIALRRSHKSKQALQSFQTVIKLNPNSKDAYYKSAEIYLEQQEWQKAQEYFAKAKQHGARIPKEILEKMEKRTL